MAEPDDITTLLVAWRRGDADAFDRLAPLVYEELRRMARRHLRGERPGHILEPTALVHEAFIRLIDARRVDWHDRTHFFSMAARAMRRILVDAARARRARKRDAGRIQITLDETMLVSDPDRSLVALDDALKTLESVDERRGRVVELRFFGGLTVQETAAILDVSPDTVSREWLAAKEWLLRETQKSRDA